LGTDFRVGTQPKLHGGDEILSFFLPFENTVAIPKPTGFFVEYVKFTTGDMKCGEGMKAVFNFNPISANVLDGTGTHGTGN